MMLRAATERVPAALLLTAASEFALSPLNSPLSATFGSPALSARLAFSPPASPAVSKHARFATPLGTPIRFEFDQRDYEDGKNADAVREAKESLAKLPKAEGQAWKPFDMPEFPSFAELAHNSSPAARDAWSREAESILGREFQPLGPRERNWKGIDFSELKSGVAPIERVGDKEADDILNKSLGVQDFTTMKWWGVDFSKLPKFSGSPSAASPIKSPFSTDADEIDWEADEILSNNLLLQDVPFMAV